ncbi:leucyl aminopeptidase [Abyssisolibacter fermentans]|uniref:leucyl aminopeptidase n=1 Tax=Abyssisolibacter fermentans TaxID=1766203 RepID=UPI00083331DE|nr:leucyl aminopeptidase [Abyssisolibacter fermentans]
MKFFINRGNSNTKVFYTYEDSEILGLDQPSESIMTAISYLKESGEYAGKMSDIGYIANYESKERLIFVGLGNKDEVDEERIRRVTSNLAKFCRDKNILNFELYFTQVDIMLKKFLTAFVESMNMTLYKYNAYKVEKEEYTLEDIYINTMQVEELQSEIREAIVLSDCVKITRDLVNEPANIQTPVKLAQDCKKLGDKYGFETTILGEKEIQELRMQSFYSVGQGSKNESQLIVMRYNGNKDSKDIIGLVGKGVTYDSGGLNLKSGPRMITMKHDMAGAGATIGVMCAIAKQKLNVNVIGVVAACENVVSSDSYKPGDIISSMSGKTFEIHSTDAEGRLTIVDAITYAIRCEKVSMIIDIATLTGASRKLFGSYASPFTSNRDNLSDKLHNISKKTGELMYRIPLLEDCINNIKGTISDYQNTSTNKTAGMINAALIIREFVEGKPWIHIDAAGTMWLDGEMYYHTKGGSGWGVRTLYHFIKTLQNNV